MTDSVYSRNLQSPYDYYSSLRSDRGSLEDRFNDIDNRTHFDDYLHRLQHPHTRNFVLDFGNEDAWCATDLDTEDVKLLLGKPRAKCFGTRWIHIWAPEEQKESIKTITRHYGVSERLQGLMCTEPVLQPPKPAAVPKKRHSRLQDKGLHPDLYGDLENAYRLKDLSDQDTLHELKNLTFAQVTNQIWHFSSVDHGPRYTCIGYNSLFVIPGLPIENGRELPDGKRLWSWLILCDDGTVLSIQENPFPRPQGLGTMDNAKVLLDVVRRNVRFIFAGVSKQHSATSESDSLVTIRVRHFNDCGPDQASIKQEDGPSLLFYYIFDDWVSSYGLIAKREHKYGVTLDQLRGKMLDRPEIELVNELHRLGRRLAVLKRLYQSYELIMQRMLQRQRMLHNVARSSYPDALTFGDTFGDPSLVSTTSFPSNGHTPVGVQLSSAAVARFERLVDRINLYCLSEIDSCITEKESMTFMNFNLIALKDSQAVEKLTRITILLAKATILFLPVSLMTAYFSTQIKGVMGVYTKVDYWASFGVIICVTLLLLMIFGYASDTVEGKTIYRSLVQTFFRSSRQRISQQRRGQ